MPLLISTNNNMFVKKNTGADYNKPLGVLKDNLVIVTADQASTRLVPTGFKYLMGTHELEVYVNGVYKRRNSVINEIQYGEYTEYSNFSVYFNAGQISEGDNVRFRVTSANYKIVNSPAGGSIDPAIIALIQNDLAALDIRVTANSNNIHQVGRDQFGYSYTFDIDPDGSTRTIGIMTDGDTTPDLSAYRVWKTSSTGAEITNFHGCVSEDIRQIIFTNEKTTIKHNSNIFLSGEEDLEGTENKVITLIYDGTDLKWREVGSTAAGGGSGSASATIKGQVMGLLNYDEDELNLVDKDLNGEWLGNTPVADYIGGKTKTQFGDDYGVNGVFGYFNLGNVWTSTGNMTVGREGGGGATLSSNLSLITSGYNGSYVCSTERYDLSAGTYSSRTDFSDSTRNRGYLAVNQLTTNIVIASGGQNATTTGYNYQSYTDHYDDSGSGTWTAKSYSGTLTGRSYLAGYRINTDYVGVCGGCNGTILTYNDWYSLAGNSWTSKEPLLIAKQSFKGCQIHHERMVFTGGYNGSYLNLTDRYHMSTNNWVNRTSITINRQLSSFSATALLTAVAAGGYNGSYMNSCEEFFDTTNTWTTKNRFSTSRSGHVGFSPYSSLVVVASGSNGSYLTSSEQFKDSSIWTRYPGKRGINASNESLTNGIYTPSTFVIETNRLTNRSTEIKNVTISALYNKKESATAPTVDISLSDGTSWVTAQLLDTDIKVSDLSPDGDGNYKLKLKFNLTNDGSAGTFETSSTSLTDARAYSAGFGLDNNYGIVLGGENGVYSYSTSTDKFSSSGGTWTSRTTTLAAKLNSAVGLTTDIGAKSGGYNGSVITYYNNGIYTDSADVYAWKAELTSGRYGNFSAPFSYDSFIIVGGYNGSSFITNNERFSIGQDSWTTRTQHPDARAYGGSISLTNDLALIASGSNGSYLGSSNRYSNSGNAWTSRLTMLYSRYNSTGLSFNADCGMIADGVFDVSGAPTYKGYNEYYYDYSNLWRQAGFRTEYLSGCSGMSFTSDVVALAGGYNGSYRGTTQKYTKGETQLIGFGVFY